MESQKQRDVVEAVQRVLDVSAGEVEDFIYADWAEGTEHDTWLLTASVQEIADWVIAGLS